MTDAEKLAVCLKALREIANGSAVSAAFKGGA